MRSKNIVADKKYLVVPVGVAPKATYVSTEGLQYLQILENGVLKEEYELYLSEKPRAWSCVYLNKYTPGTQLEIRLEGGNEDLIELLEVSDTLKDADTLYKEPKRPLIHFSPMHGFMNDPNGLCYYNGTYHYFSQLNPFGFGACNTHWLHATSTDLYHWEEQPYAIIPQEDGRIYSGSGVVDYANTSGFQTGEHPPMLLFYTPSGGKSRWGRGKPFEIGIAISTDGGETFHKYDKNPIIKNISFMNRDPKVVWCPEENCWVMVIFLDNDNYMFLVSDNLVDWEQTQVVDVPGSAECPDIFRLPLDGDENNYKWVLWACTDNYIVGHFENKRFVPETDIVYGPSHRLHSAYKLNARTTGGYAAQTYFGVPGGRVIQHSWLRPRTNDTPFMCCTSIPNEIKLVSTPAGPRLSILPAKEIEVMYESTFEVKNRGLEEIERLPMTAFGECMDIHFVADIKPGRIFAFTLRGILIVYDPTTGYLLLPTNAYEIGKDKKQLDLRIVTDRLSMEIYTGDGLFDIAVCREYDPNDNILKPIWAEADFAFDLTVHKLGNIWEK